MGWNLVYELVCSLEFDLAWYLVYAMGWYLEYGLVCSLEFDLA